MKNIKLTPLNLLFSLVHLFITFAAAINYPGSYLIYALFSLSFLVLALVAISSLDNPSFLFFGLMLWLGFFGKITAHLILLYPFVEPTGSFSGLPSEWDQTLLVAAVAGCACIASRTLIGFFQKKQNVFLAQITEAPMWFANKGYLIYLAFMALVIFVCLINMVLGINLSGVAAMTVLPWPLNAVIGWLLYIGLAILAAQLAQWEYSTMRVNTWGFSISLFEGLFSSVSIISRGLMLFHTIPIVVVSIINKIRFNLSWRNQFVRFGIIVIAFAISSSAVTLLRSSLFGGLILNQPGQGYSLRNTLKMASLIDGKLALVTSQISGLTIDRWVGAEGVMAVVAYPYKSFEMMTDSLFRTPRVGEADIYETISKSAYVPSKQYVFATIPGPAAFFFYGGSLWVVFLGMFTFVTLMGFVDNLVSRTFSNCFLSAQIGFYVANCMAQFGISPRPLLISFFMTTCALVGMWTINKILLRKNIS